MAAFRRGADWRPTEVFRLREIAEFGLGNAVIALVVPPSTTIGDASAAVHACGVPGVVFVIGGGYVLIRRQQSLGVQTDRRW